ncbi:hypothetical protein LIA77_04477 [Sarocladium implicatum]|nr:hypothetical protein LIA77_04477 [Sarocladium implicatum]
MLFLSLAAAAGLAAPMVEAAPRGLGSRQYQTRAAISRHLREHNSGHYREQRTEHHPRNPIIPPQNATSATNSTAIPSRPTEGFQGLPIDIPGSKPLTVTDIADCPHAKLVVSTTTVDVVVYVTKPAEPATTTQTLDPLPPIITEPCDDPIDLSPGADIPEQVSDENTCDGSCEGEQVEPVAATEEDCETSTSVEAAAAAPAAAETSKVADIVAPAPADVEPITTTVSIPTTTVTSTSSIRVVESVTPSVPDVVIVPEVETLTTMTRPDPVTTPCEDELPAVTPAFVDDDSEGLLGPLIDVDIGSDLLS